MTVPGVGAVVSITFTSAIDDPGRFRRSKDVGAHLGLTPKKYQSGKTDRTGAISKAGDAAVRTALFEAANVMHPQYPVLEPEGMGTAGSEPRRDEESQGGAGPQARRRSAPDVGRRHELPLDGGVGGPRGVRFHPA
jgi:Transposase IS116/IS110/IS902 family